MTHAPSKGALTTCGSVTYQKSCGTHAHFGLEKFLYPSSASFIMADGNVCDLSLPAIYLCGRVHPLNCRN